MAIATRRKEAQAASPSVEMDENVARAFADFQDDIRATLLDVRDLVFQTATDTSGVGKVVETLKWGQPSYLTARPKSGTTIRFGLSKDDRPALFFHCQTSLISEFRDIHDGHFDFEGNRCLILRDTVDEQRGALEHCISQALTYHLRK